MNPPSRSRFFVPHALEIGARFELGADDARKLVVVLRSKSGDEIEVVASTGRRFVCELDVDGPRAAARATRELEAARAPALALSLAQGIPKGAKMDYVVEKATELGLVRVLPFTSERTVGEGERAGKVERWRRLARTAAQQCARHDVPAVAAPQAFEAVLASFASYDVALVAWELAAPVPLRESLPPLLARVRTALVVIGPEGGLSAAEARAASAAGGRLVSLGSRILRSETAGLVACSALLYASGDL